MGSSSYLQVPVGFAGLDLKQSFTEAKVQLHPVPRCLSSNPRTPAHTLGYFGSFENTLRSWGVCYTHMLSKRSEVGLWSSGVAQLA